MLKRVIILLIEFGAGLAGNLVAGWIQQDAWQGLFTPWRLLATAVGAVLGLLFIALLESERNLSWNWRWHRFWYLRALAEDRRLRRWESDFARLKLAYGRGPLPTAEVLAEGERQDVVQVLRGIVLNGDEKGRRALVLGEPGSGKTTALERLTWELAREGARRLGRGRPIPVLLRLGNYREGDLLPFAGEEMLHAAAGHSGKVLSRGLPELMEQGRVALLCDALDEALGQRRDEVLAKIDRLLHSRLYAKAPVILSARTREDPGNRLGDLPPYTIQDLHDEAVRAFIRVYRRETDAEVDVLARLQQAGLLEAGGLGRNPFWLQLVVQSGAFQARKGPLLNQSVQTLLEREWDEKPLSSGWARPLPRDEQLYETRTALMWLAYQMSVAGVVSLPYEQVLHRLLPDWLQQRKGRGALRPVDIVGLGRDAKLLIYGPGPIRFRHRLIQEALTAQLLAQDETLRLAAVAHYAGETGWWETLIMLGQLAPNPGGLVVQVLESGRSEGRLFLAAVIWQSSGQPETDVRRELSTALEDSLREGVTAGHKAAALSLAKIIREDIVTLLLGLLQTGSLALQQSALELLAEIRPLSDTVHDADDAQQWSILQVLGTKGDDETQELLAGTPATWRIRIELAIEQIRNPLPGAGIIVRAGQWLPDVAWGREVPAGVYNVGGDSEAYGSFPDKVIELGQPYQLARYPITYAQFQCFVDADDFAGPEWWQDIPVGEQQIGEQRFKQWNHPRENVSWYQAVAFCRWLSAKSGRDIDLPHEYEWEVAARYPDNRVYPWGDAFDKARANTGESGVRRTTPVDNYPAGKNPTLELYDLSGNVWEWCRNKYEEPDSPKSMEISSKSRPLRGGSWDINHDYARAAYRNGHNPYNRNGHYGFRLVVRRPPSRSPRAAG